MKALGSLRLEKGYRDYGHDVDNTDTVVDAGLSFTCDFAKPSSFVGREAVLGLKEKTRSEGGRRKAMVNVLCKTDDDGVMLHHGEILWRDGVRVGEIRAGSYGHSVGGCVGLCMVEGAEGEIVNRKFLEEGEWQVEVGGKGKLKCEVGFKPYYDPENKMINM